MARDLHSYLRNEVIARTLYLCKDVETFGSGLRKIYSLCDASGVTINYTNSDMDFTFEFSRIDRNIMPKDGRINGTINDTITELESDILSWLKEDPHLTVAELAGKSGKSLRTVNRGLASLKNKGLVWRVGSNKTGYWRVQ